MLDVTCLIGDRMEKPSQVLEPVTFQFHARLPVIFRCVYDNYFGREPVYISVTHKPFNFDNVQLEWQRTILRVNANEIKSIIIPTMQQLERDGFLQ